MERDDCQIYYLGYHDHLKSKRDGHVISISLRRNLFWFPAQDAYGSTPTHRQKSSFILSLISPGKKVGPRQLLPREFHLEYYRSKGKPLFKSKSPVLDPGSNLF